MKNLISFLLLMFIFSSNINAQGPANCKYCGKKFNWSTNTTQNGTSSFKYQGYVIPERGSCAELISKYASLAQFALKNNIPGGKELVNYLWYGEKYCSKKCVIEDGTCIKE